MHKKWSKMHSFAFFHIIDTSSHWNNKRSLQYSSADCFDDLHNKSHLFGGGLSGHAQSTVAHGGGSRSEGGGRADKEGGNSELHVDNGLAGVSKSEDNERLQRLEDCSSRDRAVCSPSRHQRGFFML
eukprot:scaffold6443_cov61-Skeletonema_dohrnii-CCMP3373.AAC.1